MKHKFALSILNVVMLSIVVISVSISFINDSKWIGIVLIALSFLCILSLIPFNVSFKAMLPDIFFGIIDNGILAILAIFGGHFAGVTGAIIGGVVGNSLSDGVAGIFEGHAAERLRSKLISEERTMLKSAVGKMAGCLLGAGAVLAINGVFGF